MTVYLIRHGQTAANRDHLYCGSTDLPLSPEGAEELKGLRYQVENVRFVTSGMRRTRQTLEILFGDVPYAVEPRFREVDFGAFEMKSYESLKEDPDYQTWLAGNNEENVPPGGESGAQMTARVLEAFREIREDTVIVTHGGVIAAIMASLFPEAGRNRYQWQPRPGGGYRVTLQSPVSQQRLHFSPKYAILKNDNHVRKGAAYEKTEPGCL